MKQDSVPFSITRKEGWAIFLTLVVLVGAFLIFQSLGYRMGLLRDLGDFSCAHRRIRGERKGIFPSGKIACAFDEEPCSFSMPSWLFYALFGESY